MKQPLILQLQTLSKKEFHWNKISFSHLFYGTKCYYLTLLDFWVYYFLQMRGSKYFSWIFFFFLPALQKMFCMYQLLRKVQKYYFCSATIITVKLIFYRPQKFYQSLTINENIFDILVLHVIMLPPEKKKIEKRLSAKGLWIFCCHG